MLLHKWFDIVSKKKSGTPESQELDVCRIRVNPYPVYLRGILNYSHIFYVREAGKGLKHPPLSNYWPMVIDWYNSVEIFFRNHCVGKSGTEESGSGN